MTPTVPDFNNTTTAFAFRSTPELKRALSFFKMIRNPWIAGIGQRALKVSLTLGLPVKGLLKNTLYKHFCGGETFQQCIPLVNKLGTYNVYSILDYGVEGQTSEKDMDNAAEEIVSGVKRAGEVGYIPFSVFKPTSVGSFSLYNKVSAAEELSEKEIERWTNLRGRLDYIFSAAYENQVPVFVDAEESWIQKAIDELVMEGMMKYNRERAMVWNTYQLYRKDRLDYLEQNISTAREHGFRVGAKLVRGAYLEKERLRAERKGYDSPVHESKANTDRDYNQAMISCLENSDITELCAATHNETSCRMLADEVHHRNISPNDNRIWFSQLYGMCDYLSFNLASAGFNVAKYIPYGPVKAVVPYLLRRAEENASVKSQAVKEMELIHKELDNRKKEG